MIGTEGQLQKDPVVINPGFAILRVVRRRELYSNFAKLVSFRKFSLQSKVAGKRIKRFGASGQIIKSLYISLQKERCRISQILLRFCKLIQRPKDLGFAGSGDAVSVKFFKSVGKITRFLITQAALQTNAFGCWRRRILFAFVNGT